MTALDKVNWYNCIKCFFLKAGLSEALQLKAKGCFPSSGVDLWARSGLSWGLQQVPSRAGCFILSPQLPKRARSVQSSCMNPLPPESLSDTLLLTSQRLKSILKAFFGVSIHNIHSLFPLRSIRGRRQIFQKALRGLCLYSLPFFPPFSAFWWSEEEKKPLKLSLSSSLVLKTLNRPQSWWDPNAPNCWLLKQQCVFLLRLGFWLLSSWWQALVSDAREGPMQLCCRTVISNHGFVRSLCWTTCRTAWARAVEEGGPAEGGVYFRRWV